MFIDYNLALVVGGGLSFTAALLHLAVVAGGPSWYHLFGAGRGFVRAAQAGRWYPAVITLAIAAVLAVFALYALSAAALMPALLLLRPVLCMITLIYLIRGVAGPLVLRNTGRSDRFIWISSAVCLVFGLVHLLGLVQVWTLLDER